MLLSSFNTASIAGATISAAVLHLQYGAEDGYSPTTANVRYDNSGSPGLSDFSNSTTTRGDDFSAGSVASGGGGGGSP